MSLLHIANIPIVEPFIQDSVLGGLRQDSNKIKFSDIYDLDMFNYISQKEGAPIIIPYSNYIHHAPKKAIFVLMKKTHCNCSTIPPPEVIWEASEGSDECYPLINETSLLVNTGNTTVVAPIYNDGHTYCYIRIVRAYHMLLSGQTITLDQFKNTIMNGRVLEGIVLVLSLWRTPWQVGRCNKITLDPQKISDSPHLQEAVERYKRHFKLVDGEYVGVMLRSEHAYLMIQTQLRQMKTSPYTLEKCLNEVLDQTKHAMTETNTLSVFVTADIGQFGTNSWNDSVHKGHKHEIFEITDDVQKTIDSLYHSTLSFTQWEHSFIDATKGLKDKGYISAIQRVLASRARCLILLGGGSFQRMALTSYLVHTQPQKLCVHLICMDRTYNKQFNKQISRYYYDT